MTTGAGEATPFDFLLVGGFTLHAFSSAVEVLRLANKLGGRQAFPFRVASPDGSPVAGSNGVRIAPDIAMDEIDPRAILVLVAGHAFETFDMTALAPFLRKRARRGQVLWGASSGAGLLARAGLLDGRRASIHWEDATFVRENHPKVVLSSQLYEADGDLVTCSGGAAAADMMLDLVRRTLGSEITSEIAARLILDDHRDGRLSQWLPSDLRFRSQHPQVHRAVEAMRKHIHEPIAIGEISARQGISQRQMERLFIAELGTSPRRVYERLRMEHARHEVLQGRRRITEIALDYGYSATAFARIYARHFERSPSEDRKAR